MKRRLTCFFLLIMHCIFASQVIDLSDWEASYISQFGEDGVVERIFQIIPPTSKYYVEFGAGKGHIWSNTKYFRETYGWKGLLMDCRFTNPAINLHKAFITPSNINKLFAKYHVPKDLDLLSIDIDYNDFYVLYALNYRPKVVIVEFNSRIPPHEDKVVKFNEKHIWDCTSYHSASILAFEKLAQKKGYSVVYQPLNSVNLILVRKDLIPPGIIFKNADNVEKLFRKPTRKYHDPKNRSYITSEQAMNIIDRKRG